jgi:DNA-binding LacI/PurR family transcriptional regulator
LAIQVEETRGGPAPEHQLMLRARARLVDGLILNPVSLETSAIQPGVVLPPVVVIGEVDQPIAGHVWIDNVAASAAVVGHLADRGRRRIAAVGALHALAKAGRPVPGVVTSL